MTKEQRFFNALRDVFVGARVEGQSGFINLMRIKSRYYEEGVFPRLKEDISRYTPAVPSEETLERAIRLFERQSQVDYFINKDARAFLQEQLDLWLYQYVFEPEERRGTLWTEGRVRQLQVLRDIASKIIHFIAQFEDELVRIWNKPRFVLESHYIITLDRISAQEGGPGLLEQLLHHPGMAAQVQEWRDLGMVDENFSPAQIGETDLLGHRLHPRYQYLPLDTRHFPDLEESLIGLFDGLDDALDGWLVHSENYQALLTMQPRFQGRVKCIYIDPPYNTGHDEFIYEDRFQHSSWLTMMENRLRLAEPFLKPIAKARDAAEILGLIRQSLKGEKR
jgi:adenine-specific DNA-methyltransferase